MKPKNRRRSPRSEEEERAYWSSHDSTDLIDWTSARRLTLPNLKPSVRTISLRLPQSMLEELKRIANKRDVPYQSLIKLFLADQIRREMKEEAA